MKKSNNVEGPVTKYGDPSLIIATCPLVRAYTTRSRRSVVKKSGKGVDELSEMNWSRTEESQITS
ncbi:hypothetical protein D3C86_1692720 [compost metagenome]